MPRGQFNAARVKSSRRGKLAAKAHHHSYAPFGTKRSLGKTEIVAAIPGTLPQCTSIKDVPLFIHTIVPGHSRPDNLDALRVRLPPSTRSPPKHDAPAGPRNSTHHRLRRSISTDTFDSGTIPSPTPTPSPLSARSPRSPRSDIIQVRLPPVATANGNDGNGQGEGVGSKNGGSTLEYRNQEPFVPMVVYPMEMYGPPPPMGYYGSALPLAPPAVYYHDGMVGPSGPRAVPGTMPLYYGFAYY